MKKIQLAIFSLLISTNIFSYECKCEDDSLLINIVSCDTILFTNKSILYRQFNCDSSWLMFENKEGNKKLLYSLQAGLIELTERLGFQFEMEYNSHFLIRNNLISGCCTKPEYLLFNKKTGKKEIELGKLILFSSDKNKPHVVYSSKSGIEVIVIRNFETNKIKILRLPKERFIYTLQNSNVLEQESLFDDSKIIGNVLYLKYNYLVKGTDDIWKSKLVKIGL
ncbi:MAG TPA: hypothetical protein PK431_00590 [Chitinophagales bacterium]|nr:hypothetical protein [Chitinophagales bacterium]